VPVTWQANVGRGECSENIVFLWRRPTAFPVANHQLPAPEAQVQAVESQQPGGDRSTPHFYFEAGHAREMPEVVRDQGHPLGYRM
jgi:hypothetical protein